MRNLRTHMRRLMLHEDGGAYTLSYVMVVPLVMLFVCLVVESTLMLSAKLGTVYSAYAGARAASVWSSAASWDRTEQRIRRAAIQSFVPFASGASSLSSASESDGDAEIDRYIESYREFVDNPVSEAYARKKYQNALGMVTVTTNGPPATWDADITVTVEYACPFRIPGIGRLLGESGEGGYYFPLRSQVTLQNEAPQNATQELGIGYGTLD